jgi:hypothetical protein
MKDDILRELFSLYSIIGDISSFVSNGGDRRDIQQNIVSMRNILDNLEKIYMTDSHWKGDGSFYA